MPRPRDDEPAPEVEWIDDRPLLDKLLGITADGWTMSTVFRLSLAAILSTLLILYLLGVIQPGKNPFRGSTNNVLDEVSDDPKAVSRQAKYRARCHTSLMWLLFVIPVFGGLGVAFVGLSPLSIPATPFAGLMASLFIAFILTTISRDFEICFVDWINNAETIATLAIIFIVFGVFYFMKSQALRKMLQNMEQLNEAEKEMERKGYWLGSEDAEAWRRMFIEVFDRFRSAIPMK